MRSPAVEREAPNTTTPIQGNFHSSLLVPASSTGQAAPQVAGLVSVIDSFYEGENVCPPGEEYGTPKGRDEGEEDGVTAKVSCTIGSPRFTSFIPEFPETVTKLAASKAAKPGSLDILYLSIVCLYSLSFGIAMYYAWFCRRDAKSQGCRC